jgi:RNA polymerase sigma-70 factor, ECF subfamily
VRDDWSADDLTQETFIRIQRHLDTVKDPAKVSAWIFRIAHNLCQDHFRASKKSARDANRIEVQWHGFRASPLQKKLEQDQMGRCVQEKMDFLPPSYRAVLVLADMMSFSTQEIAEILGISVANVKVRVYRARARLRAILEEHCTFEVDERNVLVCEPVCGGEKPKGLSQ